MVKYIAVERTTPDVPRAWGEGDTDLIARYQCEIALREKLLGKIERGWLLFPILLNLGIDSLNVCFFFSDPLCPL